MKQIFENVFSQPRLQGFTLLVVSLLVLLADIHHKELFGIYAYYASISKTIVETGDWLNLYAGEKLYINKPPLVFWLSAVSMKAFGVSTFTALLPIPLFGAGSILLINWLGHRLYDRATGWLAGFVCLTTFFFLQNSTSFRMEPVLLFGVLLAVTGALFAPSRWQPAYFFSGITIAVLAKGPIGFLPVFIVPLYLKLSSHTLKLNGKEVLRWLVGSLLLLPIIAWYLHLELVNKVAVMNTIANDALAQQEVKYGWLERTWRYYLAPLGRYYWPWLPFLILGVRKAYSSLFNAITERQTKANNLLLLAWLALVFIGASLKPMGFTRYLFLALVPMSLLVAREIVALLKWQALPWWIPASLANLVALSFLLLTFTPVSMHRDTRDDITAMGNRLSAVYGQQEDLFFLTNKHYFSGDNPLWMQAWSHFYLGRKITPLYEEEIKNPDRLQGLIVLTRIGQSEKLPADVELVSLAKSRHIELKTLQMKNNTVPSSATP